MESDERAAWIARAAKYVRICADSIEKITIETSDGDTVTFKKGVKKPQEVDNDV